jgi:hypothetical protein
VVWSFLYVALCRMLQLVVLLGRSERSKGPRDPRAPARAGDPAPAAAAGAVSTSRSGASRCVRAGAAAERLGETVCASGDAASLAPPAGQAALDLSAPTSGAAAVRSSRTGACSSTGTREPGLGLPTDPRRTAEPRHLCLGDLGADDPSPPRAAAGAAARRAHGETFSASTRRRRWPVISSPSRPPG